MLSSELGSKKKKTERSSISNNQCISVNKKSGVFKREAVIEKKAHLLKEKKSKVKECMKYSMEVIRIQIKNGVEEALIESVDDDLEAFKKLGFEDIKCKSDLKASADEG